MSCDSNFQRDRVQETCRTLRVLNAVRDPDIGIPLSIQQYKVFAVYIIFLEKETIANTCSYSFLMNFIWIAVIDTSGFD